LAYSYQNAYIFIISTILGIGIYTVLFLLFLGIKIIRRIADSVIREIWIVTQVGLVTLVIVVTTTALVFIFFDRPLSGRFLYISAILGLILLVSTFLGIVSVSPFKVALGLKRYTWIGLVVGNSIIILSNVFSFFLRIPSML